MGRNRALGTLGNSLGGVWLLSAPRMLPLLLLPLLLAACEVLLLPSWCVCGTICSAIQGVHGVTLVSV